MTCTSLANYAATFKFTGKSAHAAAAPHLGQSALDAVELMNVGVNYLREHIIPEARVHYAITNSRGRLDRETYISLIPEGTCDTLKKLYQKESS